MNWLTDEDGRLLAVEDGDAPGLPLLTERGQYRYRVMDGRIVLRTDEELAAELAAMPPPPPSEVDDLRAEVAQLQAALEDAESNAYQAAREGLTAIPQPGEAWHDKKRYIRGDTVTDGGMLYEALRYSRGRQPSQSPEHWRIKPAAPTGPRWEDDVSGHTYVAGDYRTYDLDGDAELRKLYRCKQGHKKALVRRPAPISDYWEVVSVD